MGAHNRGRFIPSQRGAQTVWFGNAPRFHMLRFIIRASTPHWSVIAWRVVQLVVVLALGIYIGASFPLNG